MSGVQRLHRLPKDLVYLVYCFIPGEATHHLPLTDQREVLKRLTGMETLPLPDAQVTHLLELLGKGEREMYAHPLLWPYFEQRGLLTEVALVESSGIEARQRVMDTYRGRKRAIPTRVMIALFAYPMNETWTQWDYTIDWSVISKRIRERDGIPIDALRTNLFSHPNPDVKYHLILAMCDRYEDLNFVVYILKHLDRLDYDRDLENSLLDRVASYGEIELIESLIAEGFCPTIEKVLADRNDVSLERVLAAGLYNEEELRSALHWLETMDSIHPGSYVDRDRLGWLRQRIG